MKLHWTTTTIRIVTMFDQRPRLYSAFGQVRMRAARMASNAGVTGRRCIRWNRIATRSTAMLCLVAFVMATMGLPLPISSSKDRSVAFPCQNSPCGCQNAEQCWKSCCCHSLEERLAWAKRNDVTPPKYVAALKLANSTSTSSSLRTSCCTKSATFGDQQTCCSNEHARAKPAGETHDPSTSESNEFSGTVLLLSAFQCKGLTMNWVATGIPVLPRMAVIQPCICSERLCSRGEKLGSADWPEPPVPPPRPWPCVIIFG